MKTIYLHIGAPKTGTSSIQSELRENSKLLDLYGVSYPDYVDEIWPYPHKRNISTGNVNPLAYSMRWMSDSKMYKDFEPLYVINRMLKESKSDSIIWSHEDLLYANDDFLNLLKNELIANGWTVKPVMFIRDQISWLISAYKQHVWQKDYSDSFSDYVKFNVGGNWASIVKRYENIFGKENIIVKFYDRSFFASSITIYFLKSIGFEVDIDSWSTIVSDKNKGISCVSAIVLANMNKFSDNRKNKNKVLSWMEKKESFEDIDLLTQEIIERINIMYADGNKFLIDNYLTGKESVLLLNAMKKKSNYDIHDMEKVLDAMSFILVNILSEK